MDNIEFYIAYNNNGDFRVHEELDEAQTKFVEDGCDGPFTIRKVVISGLPPVDESEVHIDLSGARRDEDGNLVLMIRP